MTRLTRIAKNQTMRIVLSLLLLLMTTTAWATDNGPWTWYGQRSGCCDFWGNYSISYNGLNNTHWENLYMRQYTDKFGAFVSGNPGSEKKNAVYTLFGHTENVPSYTRMRLNCNYMVKQSFTGTTAWHTTALYARDDVDALKAMPVDFTDGGSDHTGDEYSLHRSTLKDKGTETKNYSNSFDFDNRNSSSAQSKTWALMMTTVVAVHGAEFVESWSEFTNESYTWDYYYYKHITFDNNGGSGEMSQQTIENSGTLTSNTMYRDGYVFIGWNTKSDGSGTAYADGATLTATSEDKGPVTLYAQWVNEGDADLIITSAADWNTFASNVTSSTESYLGKVVKLAADISVSTPVGNPNHRFRGTFDGCGHILNFNFSSSDAYAAPFNHVYGATIKNLIVTGTINGAIHCSGLVGGMVGNPNLIENCDVRVAITCSSSHCGGFIGHASSSINTIRNCRFSGSITGGSSAVGIFQGWAGNNNSLINCLADGTYYGCVDLRLAYGDNNAITNSYKTQNIGSQGTYTTATGETLRAMLGDGWEVREGNVVPKMTSSLQVEVPSVSYRAYNTTTRDFETLAATGCISVTASTTTMGEADTETWYFLNNNVTISSSRIEVLGTVHLILADGKKLRAEKGLHVAPGMTLNIYDQSGGTGQLQSFATTDGQAGIGGNYEEAGGTITIHGGSIEAIGCNWGAGIGGGRNGNGGTITIYGGTINATGGDTGAGIGGGVGANCGTVTIIGGTVMATARTAYTGDESQAIGSGAGTGISAGTLIIDGTKVYSSANASSPVAPANRLSTCQSKYAKLMPCTSHNYVDDVCTLCGTYAPVSYLVYQTATHSFVEHTVDDPTTINASTTTMGADGTETWYVVRSNVTVGSRIEVRGTVHLILRDGKTLTASKGIMVNTGNSLTIYGQSGGTGVLNATAYDQNNQDEPYKNAGIGSNNHASVGDITIHGGRITAEGNAWSAGIGGGVYGGGGSVTIYGGIIKARGHDTGSEAIGHGSSGAAVTRNIAKGFRIYVGGTLETYGYLSWSLSQNQDFITLTPCTEHQTTTNQCDYCGIACGSVIYNSNNATSGTVPPSSATCLPGETVTVLDNTGSLVRTGYTFGGWNTQADGLGTNYAPGATITISGSVTLYAKWMPITYTVRFHKNDGGEDVYSDQEFTYGIAQALTANAFTRDGYDFVGWSTTTSGAVAYTDGQSVNNLANVQDAVVNLYAKWTELYSISYVLDGGTVATPNPTTYSELSAAITLNNPTRDGYVFIGWTGNGLTEPTMTVTIPKGSKGNRTYTATWAEIFAITYDLDGGSVATSNPTTYTIVSQAITLNNPSKQGYTFIGWTGSNGDTPQLTVTIPTGSSGNLSYTANWAIGDYYLAYNTSLHAFERLPVPDNPTTVTSSNSAITLSAGWYVVTNNVSFSKRVTVSGAVNLILYDSKTLTATMGITVSSGNTLNIYSQLGGTGKLIASVSGNPNNAGIGSVGNSNDCGNINIHGGIITATGGPWSAGIGGGVNRGGGTVNIYGGTVNATGRDGESQAIGKGSSGGDVTRYIADGQSVFVGSNTTPVNHESRISSLNNKSVRIEPCYEHNYSEGICTWCGTVMLTLANNTDNRNAISTANGNKHDVILAGRTLYTDGDWNTLCLPFALYNFTGTPLEGATVKTLESTAFSDGTLTMTFSNNLNRIDAGKPYIVKWGADLVIRSAADWNTFADNVNSGIDSYQGKKVLLADDISVSTMVGTSDNPFKETFDGCGHTLNVTLSGSNNTAPFSYVGSATIRNLKVDGSVTTTDGHPCSGLVGFTNGALTITNCVSSVTFTSGFKGNAADGGIVGGIDNNSGIVTIENCSFTGKILTTNGTASCGGIVGWRRPTGVTLTIKNCLYAPAALASGETEPTSDSQTICRYGNPAPTITNCYYTRTLGGAQGTNASGMSNETLVSNLGDGWEISGGHVVPKMVSGIVNPVFTGVTVSDATANVSTDYVDFVGTYSPVIYTDENRSVLFLGGGSSLYYPDGQNATTIGACRAYFTLNGITAGDPNDPNAVKAFVLNFGDERPTDGVGEVQGSKFKVLGDDSWYDLNGRRLSGKPTQKGIYVNNGRKVVIK